MLLGNPPKSAEVVPAGPVPQTWVEEKAVLPPGGWAIGLLLPNGCGPNSGSTAVEVGDGFAVSSPMAIVTMPKGLGVDRWMGMGCRRVSEIFLLGNSSITECSRRVIRRVF